MQLIDVGADVYRMEDTPERLGKAVRATWKGSGKSNIMLIAHMDTVDARGALAKQPFRVDGTRAAVRVVARTSLFQ